MVLRALVHSRSNSTLLGRATTFLSALSPRDEALIIAPTRAAAAELGIYAFPSGRQGLYALTLTQLAAHLAVQPMGRLALAAISHLGIEALAARIVHAAATSGKLPYFAPVAQTPGFARALAKTITELRLQNISASTLAETGAPGRDLAHLLSLYEKELDARAVADLPLILRFATQEASHSGHRFAQMPLVLLSLNVESDAHRQLIAALAERSPAIFATAISGDDAAIGSLEQILKITPENLDTAEPATTLDRVRTWLFSPADPPPALPDTSLIFSAPGESFECVEIARRIQALAEQGTPFDRVALLLRNVEAYQPLVEEALRRAGIDHYFSRGAARPDPAGRAFLALLACAADGCSASRFAEYLSLGQIPPLDANGAPEARPAQWIPADDEIIATFQALPPGIEQAPEPTHDTPPLDVPLGWEKLLVDAAVIGGRERWSRRLRGLRAEFRAQLRDAERDNQAYRSHIERRIDQLKRLEHFALPLIDALGSLPSSERWGVWLERLTALAQMALRRPESVLAVFSELDPMSEVGPASLDEVYDVLSERLGFLRSEPPKRRYGRVFIGSIDEARGRSFDVVFLPGLAEGLFPRRSLEDPLLLDEHRSKLAAGLDTQDQRVARERMLLRSAAAAAAKNLVVSYPRIDAAQSRARVPSFYALEVVRAAEGRLPSLREFEKRAAAAAPARLDWPAPADPHNAIDDAEYDLASLQASLKLRGAAATGSARYLMQSNQALARSLRARGRRWRNFWSNADGLVDPDEPTLQALGPHRLAHRSYSPSSLQQFSACPYRFLLHAVFQLRPRDNPARLEQMDPLTRGALFHSAQFELFRALASADVLPVTPDGLPVALDLADQVLDRVAARYEDELAPAIPRVWKSEIENLRTDLRGWLQQVAATQSDWTPEHFEFSFGLAPDPNRDSASTAAEAQLMAGVRLRGSIDLIERHAARKTLRITDHKTGKAPQNRPQYVGGGALLQPLLYALAAETLLGESVESGRLFYCTQRGDFSTVDIPLQDEARRRLSRVLETIDRSIAEGFLPAAPQTGACATCDYTSVCGPYEEQRVKRKRGDRLEPLIELRHSP
ncbi:MAG TPA: PD-(D/E)XK nuclease family protein [Bryobacteraceae bacterium]|nr:PD-(D/E)XK nuclease family protein [Bryobacteraceae bacterium]